MVLRASSLFTVLLGLIRSVTDHIQLVKQESQHFLRFLYSETISTTVTLTFVTEAFIKKRSDSFLIFLSLQFVGGTDCLNKVGGRGRMS